MHKRILLKLTGELFADEDKQGIDFPTVERIAGKIAYLKNTYKIDLAIVVGGGNIFRGRNLVDSKFDRQKADFMGMTGTILNGLALQGMLDLQGIESRVMSSLRINQVCEEYLNLRANAHLDTGKVIILVGGLGRPFSTTDTFSSAICRGTRL